VILVAVQVVLNSHIEQQSYMSVSDLVEHLSPLFASFDQTCQPELPQLVTRRRLTRLNKDRKVRHAQLPGFQQGVHHSEPPRFGQELEPFGELFCIFETEQILGWRPTVMRVIRSASHKGTIYEGLFIYTDDSVEGPLLSGMTGGRLVLPRPLRRR